MVSQQYGHGVDRIPDEWNKGVIIKMPKKDHWVIAITGVELPFYLYQVKSYAK